MKVTPTLSRRDFFAAAALAAAATTPMRPSPVFAKYGEFAKTTGGQDTFAAGETSNECMYAQPGTGNCMVYKSSAPPLWQTADTGAAFKKLSTAADALNTMDAYIAKSQWTAIGQVLGASRDLRESVGFLTKASGNDTAAKQAKKVFAALDGIALAASKRDQATASLYFDKYAKAMADLLSSLSE